MKKKKHSFVLRPSINALGSYRGGGGGGGEGEIPPYNSYKGMRRPTGSYFWEKMHESFKILSVILTVERGIKNLPIF